MKDQGRIIKILGYSAKDIKVPKNLRRNNNIISLLFCTVDIF